MATAKECREFVEKIAEIAIEQEIERFKRAGEFLLPSVTIAQACLESAYGKSDLAKKAKNLFGMKKNLSGNTWEDSAWDGVSYYTKYTGEQKKDEKKYEIRADFRLYKTFPESVYDHSSYILHAKNEKKLRYAGVSKCKNARLAITLIKQGGYATSLTYVDKIMELIERWELEKYDKTFLENIENTKKEEVVGKIKYKINVHAGHCPDGKGASGAVGLIKESTEARKIKNELVKFLKAKGCTIYDCTCDTAETQTNCLKKICKKCNAHEVDLDVSIHFNSGRNDKKGDGKIGGFETWMYCNSAKKDAISSSVRKKMKSLGFTDRGSKTTKNLYYINHTVAPAILLEICFVDDADDAKLYKKLGAEAIAKAIGEGILKGLQV